MLFWEIAHVLFLFIRLFRRPGGPEGFIEGVSKGSVLCFRMITRVALGDNSQGQEAREKFLQQSKKSE